MADHPLYVRARAALLDAVDALGPHLDAVVLVGAQAIYLHTGDADLAVAEYTTDADFTISPQDLGDEPLLGELLGAAGFTTGDDLGRWLSHDGIFVDLMAPEALAGPVIEVRVSDHTGSGRLAGRRVSKAPWWTANDA